MDRNNGADVPSVREGCLVASIAFGLLFTAPIWLGAIVFVGGMFYA